jgi:hypothetical protein
MVTGGGLDIEGLSTVGVAVGSQSFLALEMVVQESSVIGRGLVVKEILLAGVTARYPVRSTVNSSVKE